MIKNLLHGISKSFWETEENVRSAEKYRRMTKEPGWAVHQGLMVQIANQISLYMLSEDFTRLDATEKDVQQRAFFVSKEIIDFLLNPLKGAKKHAEFIQHNKKMEATQKRGATK